MKSTYIIRRVDRLGRIVLPVEFRRTMGIGISDELELFIDGNAVVLKKLNCTCVFCDRQTRSCANTKVSIYACPVLSSYLNSQNLQKLQHAPELQRHRKQQHLLQSSPKSNNHSARCTRHLGSGPNQ